jgi:D-alanyl-D-alanine carboxypeptidase/D-alanyl-D-alanine-endopeptidase (penicillin-binding protein 4)
MNPASVMKLLTTYAALDLLGPAYTWKTTVWTDTAPVDGVLNGNLYIRGSGDPRFAIEHLWSLLRQVQVRGIRQIAGDVVLDRTAFNVPAIDPGAFDDKPMRPYNVGPDGLLLNFRAMRFTLLPDNGKPRVLMETPSEGLRIDNQLRAGRRVRQQLEGPDQRAPAAGKHRPPPRIHRHLRRAVRREAAQPGAAAGRRPGRRPDSRPVEGTGRQPWRPGARRQRAARRPPAHPARIGAAGRCRARHQQVQQQRDGPPGFPDPGQWQRRRRHPERARQRIADWLAGRNLRFGELVLDNGSGLSRSSGSAPTA